MIGLYRRIKNFGIEDQIVQDNAKTTADMKAVCYPLFCPNYEVPISGSIDFVLYATYDGIV